MGLSYLCFVSFVCLLYYLSLFDHLTVAHVTSSVQLLCHDDERSGLLQFKDSLIVDKSASEDPSAYPKVASWSLEEENSDCCSWDGIKCNQETGHIITLDLTSSCLYGSINSSSSLFHLVHLEWLSLADNYLEFQGPVLPSLFEKLTNLQVLDLTGVSISSSIPFNLGNLSSLTYLSLENCGIQGRFRINIFQLLIFHFVERKIQF